MRKILTLLLCAAAFTAVAADRRAPGWALMDSRMQWHDLADYRGKLVLLAFVQSTCPHCAIFVDRLTEVQQKYGDKVAVLAVVTPPDTPDKVRTFISEHKITFPILLDGGQMSYSYILSPDLKFPRLFVIDEAGNIRTDYEYGPVTREIFEGSALAPEVARLLKDKK